MTDKNFLNYWTDSFWKKYEDHFNEFHKNADRNTSFNINFWYTIFPIMLQHQEIIYPLMIRSIKTYDTEIVTSSTNIAVPHFIFKNLVEEILINKQYEFLTSEGKLLLENPVHFNEIKNKQEYLWETTINKIIDNIPTHKIKLFENYYKQILKNNIKYMSSDIWDNLQQNLCFSYGYPYLLDNSFKLLDRNNADLFLPILLKTIDNSE
ncbi:MAG: hypothetical protein KIT69_19610, partial [Propionibacteriaceae bacterium]|nr:hypothetical protein [Propionibacteriaceae bacterium]